MRDTVIRFFAGTTLLACGDPLVKPELIANTRVLAARSESSSDVNRAWPMPTEAGSVRWLVVGPEDTPSLAWGFSACVAESTSRGLPICASAPFAQFATSKVSPSEPRFDFTMPDEASLGPATHIAVTGAFCASGSPVLGSAGVDWANTTCPDTNESPLLATVDVHASLAGATNQNPTFSEVITQIDGMDWLAWSDGQEQSAGCADSDLAIPYLAAGGASHELVLAIPSEMSEPLPQVSVHSASRETLTLAHFVTSGDLDRAYSDVALDTDPALVTVRWSTPATVENGGRLVRFFFVLRDGRGGTDYTERAVCVTP